MGVIRGVIPGLRVGVGVGVDVVIRIQRTIMELDRELGPFRGHDRRLRDDGDMIRRKVSHHRLLEGALLERALLDMIRPDENPLFDVLPRVDRDHHHRGWHGMILLLEGEIILLEDAIPRADDVNTPRMTNPPFHEDGMNLRQQGDPHKVHRHPLVATPKTPDEHIDPLHATIPLPLVAIEVIVLLTIVLPLDITPLAVIVLPQAVEMNPHRQGEIMYGHVAGMIPHVVERLLPVAGGIVHPGSVMTRIQGIAGAEKQVWIVGISRAFPSYLVK